MCRLLAPPYLPADLLRPQTKLPGKLGKASAIYINKISMIDPDTLTKCKQLVPVLKNCFTNIENREVTVFFLSWTFRTSGHKIEFHKIKTHVSHLVKKYVKNTFDFAIRSCKIRPSDSHWLNRRMNFLIIDPICRLHRKSLSRCDILFYPLSKVLMRLMNINLLFLERKLRINMYMF